MGCAAAPLFWAVVSPSAGGIVRPEAPMNGSEGPRYATFALSRSLTRSGSVPRAGRRPTPARLRCAYGRNHHRARANGASPCRHLAARPSRGWRRDRVRAESRRDAPCAGRDRTDAKSARSIDPGCVRPRRRRRPRCTRSRRDAASPPQSGGSARLLDRDPGKPRPQRSAGQNHPPDPALLRVRPSPLGPGCQQRVEAGGFGAWQSPASRRHPDAAERAVWRR